LKNTFLSIQQRITNCLWFDKQAEEAAMLYTNIFKNSEILSIDRYGKEGFEQHKMPEGTAMTVSFKLDGQNFLALNGGPHFEFNEAISMIITCDNQDEIDHFWNALTNGGQERLCGWLNDRYGVSWQVIPGNFKHYLSHPNPEIAIKLRESLFSMTKIDLHRLNAISINA
jgi:predicted 3-demethylubiquinone-9 3-methyltransferase (glyoxalase superfamily)